MSFSLKFEKGRNWLVGNVEPILDFVKHGDLELDKVNSFYCDLKFDLDPSDPCFAQIPVLVDLLCPNEGNDGAFKVSLVPNYDLFKTVIIQGTITNNNNGELIANIIPISDHQGFWVYDAVFEWDLDLVYRLEQHLSKCSKEVFKEIV